MRAYNVLPSSLEIGTEINNFHGEFILINQMKYVCNISRVEHF